MEDDKKNLKWKTTKKNSKWKTTKQIHNGRRQKKFKMEDDKKVKWKMNQKI